MKDFISVTPKIDREIHVMKYVLFLLLPLILIACGMSEKYPEAFGIYVIDETRSDNSKFRPLRNNDDVKRVEIDISENPSILIFDRAVALDTDSFKVYSGIYIRNFRENDLMTGNKPVKAFNSWSLRKEKTTIIAGQIFPVKGHPEKVIWRPAQEMQPGLYFAEIGGGFAKAPRSLEPFFYKGSIAKKDMVSSTLCYDYYQMYMGNRQQFYPCSQNFTDGAAPISSSQDRSSARPPGPAVSALETAPPKSVDPTNDLNRLLGTWATNNRSLDRARFQTLISQGAKFDAVCNGGSMLRCAVLTKDTLLVDTMIQLGAKARSDEALLAQAAKTDDADMVSLLLKHKFPIDKGSHALCPPIFEAISSTGVTALNVLIQNGANVNIDGGICGVPLTAAVNEKRTAAIEILRRNGAKS